MVPTDAEPVQSQDEVVCLFVYTGVDGLYQDLDLSVHAVLLKDTGQNRSKIAQAGPK